MTMRSLRGAVLAALLLTAAAGLGAAEHYRVVNGPRDFYFGHISYVDPTPGGTDPSVLREGRSEPEPGLLNLPIGPGDTVRTSDDRRCEIQFDSGTIVRLDVGTEVRVQTILARSLSSAEELTVLALDKGRVYVMYREYDRRELFQVITPNAAVKMRHMAVAILSAAPDGSTEVQVASGLARVLFGPEASRLDDRRVEKGERLVVLPGHQSQLASAIAGTAFELWNKDVNAHFEDLHTGLSALPKPIQKLPPAVFYFAQAYGDRYGEWIWDDLYGYVWRPFIDNGRYPWGWSPYFYGRWSMAGGQMFWVPQEPWGWVPYHLGIWQWDKKHGWVWLPGSMFAPAWTMWYFYFGYTSWRPWSLLDWTAGSLYQPYWFGGATNGPVVLRTIVTKDSLKQPSTSGLPIPAELKTVVKRTTAAYERGDVRLREAAAAAPRQAVIVANSDLASPAIHEKALAFDQAAKRITPPPGSTPPAHIADPRREAVRLFLGADGAAPAPRRMAAPGAGPARNVSRAGQAGHPGAAPSGPPPPAPAPVRFRDWNPDLRLARELGVRIEYSSLRNEVRCPELNLSSRDRGRGAMAPRLTSGGVSFGPAVSASGQYAGGTDSSGTSGSSSSSSRTSSSRPSTTRTAESKGGSGTEKIKN